MYRPLSPSATATKRVFDIHEGVPYFGSMAIKLPRTGWTSKCAELAEDVQSKPGTSKACRAPGTRRKRNEERCSESLNSEVLTQLGPETDHATYASLLRRCTTAKALSEGKCVHQHMDKHGYADDRFLSNLLVQMYSKCGSLENAHAVFDRIGNRNLYSCNIMIAAFAQNGSLDDARALFAEMPQRDVVSWNAMISGYARNGHGQEALQLFGQMQAEGIKPSKITFICIVDACASVAALKEGRFIHATVAGNLSESDVVLGTSLINMYSKCGNLDDARAVFAEVPQQDIVSWSAMILACAHNGHGKEALQLFGQMQTEGFRLDKITFLCIVDACASLAALEECRMIHATVSGNGWESDVVVGNALINTYAKCGSLDDARAIFEEMPHLDVVSWSTMIAACSQNGHGKEALQLFGQMQAKGFMSNIITFICVVDVCASVADLEGGRVTHATVAGNGWDLDVAVGNALVNMYGKCRRLDNAKAMFEEISQRDVISWSAMIAACAQNGVCKEALQLFGHMQAEGFEPNRVTFICVVDACASVAALEEGRVIYSSIVGNGWELDVVVGNALVNMYGQCRSLHDARTVFEDMRQRDVVSWSAMLDAYAQNGHGKEALQLFGQMQAEGFEPDKVTFISVLTACSHTGQVADARRYLASMTMDHGITPSAEHYVCMVDLLGRRGLLEEAEDLIISMPFKHVPLAWLILLSSCRLYNDVERAQCAARFVFELDPRNSSPYVLLADTHANAGGSDDVLKVRSSCTEGSIGSDDVLKARTSCIEGSNVVHVFVVRATSHPQQEDLSVELKC